MISEIKKFSDSVGSFYGTEDTSVFLYSLLKMKKPATVLELGTGFASSTVWMAYALEENDYGAMFTIDDGSHWSKTEDKEKLLGKFYQKDYNSYIANLFDKFSLNRIKFLNQKIEDVLIDLPIDFLFSDFAHGPFDIYNLLAKFLCRMNPISTIVFDSASTYYSSFTTLEILIDRLNSGRVPLTLLELVEEKNRNRLKDFVSASSFQLLHLIEDKNRSQNSMAMITITPFDSMPQPRNNIRF